jgi:hypothetical protein
MHPECYARALGGCSPAMSGEHYISEGILELVEHPHGKTSKSVRAAGLAFQPPGVEKQFGVGSLVGNILCRAHNSLLGRFDTAGIEMFRALDALNDAAGNPAAPRQTLLVDGDGLERWMLKSLIGGLYSGNFRVTETDTTQGVCPPPDLLDILFQGAASPPGQGLYWMPPNAGEVIMAVPQILRVAPLVLGQVNPEVSGLRVWFFGFEFSLLSANNVAGARTKFDDAAYRPAGIRAVGSNSQIAFTWSGGSKSGEVVLHHVRP